MMAVVAVEVIPERRCDRCSDSMKDSWGCHGTPKLPIKLDDVPLERCPRRPILDDPVFYGELFSHYRAYQNGFLPEEGALASQPHMLVEAFKLIDVAVSKCDEDRRQKEAKQRNRK